jgi:hypothetical protein
MSEQTLVERLERLVRGETEYAVYVRGQKVKAGTSAGDLLRADLRGLFAELSRLSEALRKAEALKDCAPFLRDLAAFYRIEAADLVGGTHNRIIVEAEDCERWASVIAALSTPNPLKEPSE